MTADVKVAEGAGFEPAIRLPVYTLSRRAPSTTRPPLRARLFAAERTLANRLGRRNAAPGARQVARRERRCAGAPPSTVQCCRLAATPLSEKALRWRTAASKSTGPPAR